jgi:hypothetical protein
MRRFGAGVANLQLVQEIEVYGELDPRHSRARIGRRLAGVRLARNDSSGKSRPFYSANFWDKRWKKDVSESWVR